jgi:multiple sugar transport system permease protein
VEKDSMSKLLEIPLRGDSPHKKRLTVRRLLTGVCFALPFLAVFVLFFFVPFFKGVSQGFVDRDGAFVGIKNYYNILVSQEFTYREDFFNGLKNTLLFVGISVPCLIVVPLVIALLLDMEPKGYKVFRAILFMPTVFSITSVVLMWRRILEVESGFINAALKALNLRQINFLGAQPWAWFSIILVTIWWTMGTNIVILGAGLKNIDRKVYEAARVDGASYMKIVFSITIPLLISQILVVLVMTILASFNVYAQPRLLTVGGPERSTTVLLMVIMQHLYDRPYIASAMSLLLGSIMIVISLLQAGGIKLREDRKK